MATEQGTPNKKFDAQMQLHRRAWTLGTKEYEKRKDYPGDAARNHVCSHTNCLNYQWDQPEVETYRLCPECAAVSPCIVTEFFTHAPYKILPPRKKRLAACAAAFRSDVSVVARRALQSDFFADQGVEGLLDKLAADGFIGPGLDHIAPAEEDEGE